MPIFNNMLAGASGATGGAAGDFSIARSLRFNSADSAYLNRTPSSAGNRKTWTWSNWIKRSALSGSTRDWIFVGGNTASDTGIIFIGFKFGDDLLIGTNNTDLLLTNAVFRDLSAWMHIVVAFDTTQSTASNRLKVYINGVEITSFSTDNRSSIAQNGDYGANQAQRHTIGSVQNYGGNTPRYIDAYLAEINFIDGQALDPTSFGAFDDNGVWQAIDTAGLTFGTNGFRLKFADNSSNAALGTDSSGNSNTWSVNNLSVGAVSNLTAKQNFDVVTWTGNSSSRNIATTLAPDFVWIKSRSHTTNNVLYDVIRGASQVLFADTTSASRSQSSFTAFNSDSFSLGAGGEVNQSGRTYVAWCWKAGGAASSNTNGTITSSVSANAAYGFSIVSWTGAGSGNSSIGHGLSTAPSWIILKNRSATSNWSVYHSSVGNTKRLLLNSNAAEAAGSTFWNNTSPTSSVFTVGGDLNDSATKIAYVWSEIAGFSKFGSYTGNGSATGPTVTTGFKPRMIIIKRTDAAGENWWIKDTERSPSNPMAETLFPSTLDAEISSQTARYFNSLDDGFQIAGTDTGSNANGGTYIYAAFAATVDESAINDCFVDTPTNAAEPSDTGVGNEVVGNYATLNPLRKHADSGAVGHTLANGNLDITATAGACGVGGTIGMSGGGKYYWEVTYKTGTEFFAGIIDAASETKFLNAYTGWSHYGHLWGPKNSVFFDWTGGGAASTSISSAVSDGDIMGMALDLDNNSLQYYKNGAAVGSARSVTAGKTWTAWIASGNNTFNNLTCSVNFGQRAFAYPLNSNPVYSATASGALTSGSQIFNGSLSNGGYFSGAGTNTTLTTGQFTIATQLRVYNNFRSDGTYAMCLNNTCINVAGTGTNSTVFRWSTVDLSSFSLPLDVSKLGYSNSQNSGNTIMAIEVDGTILVDGDGGPYKSLNTANLPTPTIADGSKYFDAKLWNGSGSSRSISGYGFSPDWVWIKPRNAAYNHALFDIVRGSGKRLKSNDTVAEDTDNNTLSGFASDGFTLGTNNGVNQSSKTYVGWAWDGGTSTVTNNDGSIASQVRAQPSAGQSIVSYTGTGTGSDTVGHGLNAAPKIIILKDRDNAEDWPVYHTLVDGSYDYLYLNLTASNSNSGWNVPTNSVFSASGAAGSGNKMIAYCFAPVAGYSSMGIATGTGTTDGPYIYTGFKVRFLIYKRSDGTSNWLVYDTARNPSNPGLYVLSADNSGGGNTYDAHNNQLGIDFLSNGFKIKSSNGDVNTSGASYIYYAVAENPFQANGGLAR